MNDCKQCLRLRKDLETCRKSRREEVLREQRREDIKLRLRSEQSGPSATGPDGAELRQARRLAAYALDQLDQKVPGVWGKFVLLNPWLLDKEVTCLPARDRQALQPGDARLTCKLCGR